MTNVIIHCSDSSFGNSALITKWHIQERKWSTIGYHYVILNGRLSAFKRHSYFDGHIETGRPLDDDADLEFDEKGSHTVGWNNSVGICLIGLSGTFTESQLRALSSLIHRLRNQFGEIKVMQHSDVDPVNKPHCAGLSKLQIHSLNI
jgi:N-acetylmuramoyl-L-alanine amidase